MLTQQDLRELSRTEFARHTEAILESDGYDTELCVDDEMFEYDIRAKKDDTTVAVVLILNVNGSVITDDIIKHHADLKEQFTDVFVISPEKFTTEALETADEKDIDTIDGPGFLSAYRQLEYEDAYESLVPDVNLVLYASAFGVPPVAYWMVGRRKTAILCLITLFWFSLGFLITPIHIYFIQKKSDSN